MGLLDLIKEDKSFEFISLKEVINLLGNKTQSRINETATFLLNKKTHISLNSYTRAADYTIQQISYPGYDNDSWVGDNDAFLWLMEIVKNEVDSYFQVSESSKYNKFLEKTFWKREQFFTLDWIKSLNLTDYKESTLNRQMQYIWDPNYLAIHESSNCSDFEFSEELYLDYNLDIKEPENFFDSNQIESKKYPLYYKNDTFTAQEAACLFSGYDPVLVGNKYNRVMWLNENPLFEEAINFIYSAVRGDLFEEVSSGLFIIKSAQLKDFFTSKNIFIDGFNDIQEIRHENNNDLEELIKENKQLHDELAKFEEIREIAINSNNEVLSLMEENQNLTRTVSNLNNALSWLEHEKYELEDEIKILQEKIELEGQTNQINKCDQLVHPSLNKSTPSFAPELLIAIEAWEAKYLHNEYPHQEHTPAITNILKNRNITQVNLVKRICAITNPKK
ncbi:hypothetical protein ACNPMZ_08670 [Acinetobacter pittii]|uniref:hypothetical protein n=1 Tax=Acinetobacter pittii TaxID=48296 RepID=UPI000991BCEC|nr:hypothetical protein [Acinetobacter pittii]AQV17308.1 hypothetical protein BMU11_17545 [Acinetobacter pittii]MEB6625537.1 hypothetical protein [Acinetobacter pittii]